MQKTDIKQLVKNQGNSSDLCESVVGDLNSVHALAEIWKQDAQLFHIIGLNGLVEFSKKDNYSSQEMKAFKEGLAYIPDFLEKCFEERLQSEPKARQAI